MLLPAHLIIVPSASRTPAALSALAAAGNGAYATAAVASFAKTLAPASVLMTAPKWR
jgi:hypothetical protein